MTLFGVNVPYLGGEYGHDLADNPRFPAWPCGFSEERAYRPLIEARRLGFSAVRMWLCENAEGLRVEDGRVAGVSDRLIESVKVVSEAAHLHGLYLYFCLLDGNAWPRERDPITRSILADADQASRFAERVVVPIARALDPAITFALDIVNEPETSTADCECAEPIAWEHIGRAIALAGDAARAERELLVTAGTMHVFLPKLWRAGAKLDAIDVHVYHDQGGLPSKGDLAAYVGDDAIASLPLIGGELGIPKGHDEAALENYLHNAARLDYAAAFLWQLEGDLIDKSARARPWTALGVAVHDTLQAFASV